MRLTVVITLLLIIGLGIRSTQAQESDIFADPWRAEYFSNDALNGLPNLTRFDNNVGFDWGFDAPVVGLPADHFSIRWQKGGTLSAGTYRFIITASTGFRLIIDDELVLDTWEGDSAGVTIGTNLVLETGFHTIQIEYHALDGDAYIYLDWGLAPESDLPPQPTSAIENTVTVTVNTLNVRSAPRIANNIIARISTGQRFIELDRSTDRRWVQIDLGNGHRGWVSAAYVYSIIPSGETP